MTPEVRRIRLTMCQGGLDWAWTDAVTGETGLARIDLDGLEVGDDVLVELCWERRWVVTRFIDVPPRLLANFLRPPRETSDGWLGADLPEGAAWAPPEVGEIRVARMQIDGRSTADRDAGRSAKHRPAVVVWVDVARQEAGLRFIFGTNSAVRRRGMGRRLKDWRGAGLRKPSIVTFEESVRQFSELSECKGQVSAIDREWLCC